MVEDSQRVTSDTPASATATAAITAASATTTPERAPADLVDHLAGQQRSGDAEQRTDHADRDKHAQPAVMPCGEAPDPAQQLRVGQRPQVTTAGVHLPVQSLPGNRFEAHEITVKPQQWMRSTTSRGCRQTIPKYPSTPAAKTTIRGFALVRMKITVQSAVSR